MVLCLSLLFDFLFSLSMVKSTFCVSFSAETLTSCSEELSLSEVSHYESSLNEYFRSKSETPHSDRDSLFGEAVSSYCSICSPSVHTKTDDTATEAAH